MVSEIVSLASLCLEVMHLRIPDKNILWIFVVEDTESDSSDLDSEDWHFLETETTESDLEGDGEFLD